MKRLFIVVTVVFYSSARCALAENSAPVLSLESVVHASVDRSPSVSEAFSRMNEAKSGLKEVQSMNWPRLSLQSSVLRGDNPVYVFGSLLEQRQFGPQNFAIDSLNRPDYLTNYKNAVVVGVPVFTGLELQSHQKIGKLQSDVAQIQYDGALQRITLQAIQSYLSVLINHKLLAIMNERIESSREEIESARKLNARGLVLGSDFYAAQAILGGMETRKEQLEKDVQSALERLSILVGKKIESNEIKQSLTAHIYTVGSDEELLNEGLMHRSDMRAAEHAVSMAGIQDKQTGRSFWPTIEAFASIETNTNDFSSNPSNRMIGLTSNFPIGDPSYFARKDKARAQSDAAKNSKEAAQDEIRSDILSALRRYQGAVASFPKAVDTREKAQKSLELFRPLYREGRQSIIDVLRAEDGLMQAQMSEVGIVFGIHAGFAQLKYAVGGLDATAAAMISKNLESRP